MRSYEREGTQPETAYEALRESYANSDLTMLVSGLVGVKPPPTRKDDMLVALMRFVERDQLPLTWAKLTALEQEVAAQTAWSDSGYFDAQKFAATREMLRSRSGDAAGGNEKQADPKTQFGFDWSEGGGRKRHLIELLMPRGVMARDVQRSLRKLVPEPEPPAIAGVDAPPESVGMPEAVWNDHTRSYDRRSVMAPVVRRETERASLRELVAVLRLVDSGKVAITEKNRWPTPGAIRQIAGSLEGGDYYPDDGSKSKQSQDANENRPGPIRAFAWPMLLQAGKMAQARGSRLELTKTGRAALMAPPHEILRGLWERWKESDLLDELRRINVIRGQTGNGRRHLTDPGDRRLAISAALGECPVGRWVSVDEFSSHMQAAGHEFLVSSNPWTLYVAEAQYGSLGYEGYGGWDILQMRYLLCVLMEYAATLGMIDLAFIPPAGARPDYGGMWGTDDLEFFSRYDGLMFLRVTGLGAYVLGVETSYAPPAPEMRKAIIVQPNLEITAMGPLSSSDLSMLDTFAEKTGDTAWRLDAERILDAEASGRSARELIDFLEAASGSEVPEEVDRFVGEVAARASAVRDLGPARLIGCADPELAAFIAGHPAAGKLCSLAGRDKLAVAARDQAAFLRALRKLGFALRQSPSD